MMPRPSMIASYAVMVLGLSSSLNAQDTACLDAVLVDDPSRIGCVNRILEQRWLVFEKTVDASDAAEIRRTVDGGTMQRIRPIRTEDPLNDQDFVRLGNRVDLEIYLSYANNTSRIVLERGGQWEIRRDTLPQLVISHGQMVVDQLQGRLETYLQNVLNVIHSTTVYYDVDSTSGETMVFLREGHISFPDFQIDIQGSDLLWIMRPGEAPQPVPADEAVIRRWQNREEHAIEQMWERGERPILRRPRFWLLAGGLAVGAALLDCSVTRVVCNAGGTTRGGYRIPID